MRYSLGVGPVRVYGGKKSQPMPYALCAIFAIITLGWGIIGGIWAAITDGAEAGLSTFVAGLVLFIIFAAKAGSRIKH